MSPKIKLLIEIKITKKEVEQMLVELGFSQTKKIVKGYKRFCKDNRVIWLGSFYIENENCAIALEYNTKNKSEVEKYVLEQK